MPSDRHPSSELDREFYLRENAALKKEVEWLSRQVYGRVMPGLFAFPDDEEDSASGEENPGSVCFPGGKSVTLHEPAAPYHVPEPTSVPPEFPSEEADLELPPDRRGGMSVAGHESFEAVAARPAIIRRTIRRTLYVSNDGSGMACAAPAPALFPDPSGGPQMFDASFLAHITVLRMAGIRFRAVSELLNMESGLAVSEETLRGLVLSAAETVAPVCSALVVRMLPDWMNLRRMFEEAKAGGDWLADGFVQSIHALFRLEENARARAERAGGSPEDLYRERRAARMNSARITADFFARCRETLPAQNPESPLAEALRHAVEHESLLSVFLHDPRMELFRANPETPVADPFAVLAVCADECRARGVSFRGWLEEALVRLKQPNPPPPESLFPG